MKAMGRISSTIIGAIALAAVVAMPATSQRSVALPERDIVLGDSARTLFTVGRENGAEWERFSMIPAVDFDGQGNLHILDRDNGRVVVLDRSGRFVRQVGRKGGGPGEFTFPVTMAVTPSGKAAVWDLGNQRFNVFQPGGTFEKTVDAPPGVRPGTGERIGTVPGDALIVLGSAIVEREDAPPEVRDVRPLLRLPLAGGVARRLHEAPETPPEMQASGDANSRQVRVSPPPAYSPRISFAAAGDGRVVVAHGVRYDVSVVADAGVQLRITRPIAPRRTAEPDREAERQRRRELLASGAGMIRVEEENGQRRISAGGRGMAPQQIESVLANMRFADTIPVVRDVGVDSYGRIWVARDGGPGRFESGVVDLVTLDGRYLGSVSGTRVPDAFGPDGLVAYVEEDDLGVQRVVVRRVPGDWR